MGKTIWNPKLSCAALIKRNAVSTCLAEGTLGFCHDFDERIGDIVSCLAGDEKSDRVELSGCRLRT